MHTTYYQWRTSLLSQTECHGIALGEVRDGPTGGLGLASIATAREVKRSLKHFHIRTRAGSNYVIVIVIVIDYAKTM